MNQIITTRLAHEFPSYTTYVTVPGVMCLVFMALFIACPVFAMTQMSSSFASTSPAPIAFGLAACFLVLIAITAAVFSYRGKRERQQFWCKFEAVVKEKLNEINMTDEILIASNQLWSIQTEEYISGIQINHHHNDNFHNSASVVWNTDYYLILIPKHIGSFFSQQTAVEQEQQYQQADHHLVEVPLFAQRHQRPYPMDVSGDAYPIPLNGTHHQPPPPPAYSANK